MRIPITAIATLAVVTLFVGFLPSAMAHEHDTPHSHLGGAIPPDFMRAALIRYRDVVYDDSSEDIYLTSLDIYTPEPVEAGSPVMVFVHGGGFRSGDKAHAKDLDPKPEWFTNRLGYLFLSINYRFVPEHGYPTNAQDVANALAWVHDHIADYGGDPDQIFVMGHSAGATLVSQVATDANFLGNAGKDLRILKGVIPIDTTFDFTSMGEIAESMLGPDRAVWERASPIHNVASDKHIPPFLILHVAASNPPMDTARHAGAMAEALEKAGVRVEVVALPAKEHFTANEAIGEPGDLGTIAVRRFLESLTPGERLTAR